MDGNTERGNEGVARSFGDLVRLSGVHKYYSGGTSGVHALNGIELQLGAGEIVAICGPSGSGKTTLLSLIGMLEAPTEGSIVIASLLTGKLTEQARAELRADMIGMVFQAFTLIPVLSVRENVLLPLKLRGHLDGNSAPARADDLLAQLGLSTMAEHLPRDLDPSQSQRVAIARALIGRPRLVLADEPGARLDGATLRMTMDLFAREQAAHGTAFLITTRDQRQLSRATRTLQLSEGRLQQADAAGRRKPLRAEV
jgi:putative ABC transport system ATP-binding protein